jgi:hypothetical protein
MLAADIRQRFLLFRDRASWYRGGILHQRREVCSEH